LASVVPGVKEGEYKDQAKKEEILIGFVIWGVERIRGLSLVCLIC